MLLDSAFETRERQALIKHLSRLLPDALFLGPVDEVRTVTYASEEARSVEVCAAAVVRL